jgi:tetratricopeptide (TPR) repeat protein
MRRFATALVLLVLMAWPGTAGSAADPEWLVRLKTWSHAVMHHKPGQLDPAAVELAAWTAENVHTVVADFLSLHPDLKQKRHASMEATYARTYRKKTLGSADMRAIEVFQGAAPDGTNRVLRRAAMLHADVALLAPVDWSRSTGVADSVMVLDGSVVGLEGQSAHWVIGRALLDAVEPAPRDDPWARLWYYALAIEFLEGGNLAAAKPHLEHALKILPDDARVQFGSGYYHQAAGAPSVQAAYIAQTRLARRIRARSPGIDDAESNWKAAEKRFRRALALDPGFVEARIRLGETLLNLDRVNDASGQLRQVAGGVGHPVLDYLAQMLLGAAEERLGHRPAAAACYGRAAALFPEARSPGFALAALDRRGGARLDAWRQVERATAPPVPAQADADPWWTFTRWHAKSAKTLLAELRELMTAEIAR